MTLKSKATYVQGFGDTIRNDATAVPWYVVNGVLTSTPPDGGTAGSDGTGANRDPQDPPSVQYLLLTGDPKWADVSMEVKVRSDGQNTGGFGVIVRAAPKTKPTDPNTWYQFNYATASSTQGKVDPTKETITPDEDASGIQPPDDVPSLRIYKVVKNKYKILAETDFDRSKVRVPQVNAAGDDNATGAIFRLVAKGSLLQAWIALPGKPFEKYLEATDDELKAGLVGITHVEYNPVFANLLVQDAP